MMDLEYNNNSEGFFSKQAYLIEFLILKVNILNIYRLLRNYA